MNNVPTEATTTEQPVSQVQPTTETVPNAPPTGDQGTETTQETVDRDEKGRFRNPVQPRIDELTRKVNEQKREAAYWKQRAEQATVTPAEPKAEKPTPDQFDDYNAYVEALTDWKAEEKARKVVDEREEQRAAKQQTDARTSTWNERQEAFRKVAPDYDEVVAVSDTPIAGHVSKVLLEAERGPELLLHLAKNPDVAAKLNKLSPEAAAYEMGRLEATLPAVAATPASDDTTSTTEAPATPPAPRPRTSSAPAPVKPVGQGRSTALDLNKASMDDYVKARKAQGATWAR